MVEVEFVIRGQKITPDETQNHLERSIMIEVERSLRQRVGSLRCPEHDAAPKITASGTSAEELEFNLSGCCQRLVDQTVEALS